MRKQLYFFIYLLLPFSNFARENPVLENFKGTRGNGLNFTENRGQVVDAEKNLRPDVLFIGEGGGTQVYLRKTGISYVISNANTVLSAFRKQYKKEIKLKHFDKELQKLQAGYLKEHTITTQRIDVDFEGGNKNFTVLNEEAVEGYTNYYYPHCKDGVTYVKAYNKITYQNIYNGIDIVFYGNKGSGLKYDIIVKPGADPNNIKLLYSGANSLHLNGDSLEIQTEVFTMKDYMPIVYQNVNGKQSEVNAKYNLKKLKHKQYQVTYQFSNYNNTQNLIIDPYNYWITYYGGTGTDFPSDICNDNNGDVLITGYTNSANFPVSAGAFQTNILFSSPYILKMSNSGLRLWCTFYSSLDSTNYDYANGITHDSFNNVLITGYTNSSSFPVSNGCYQNSLNGAGTGSSDAFLLKFDANGIRLWATYFGGDGSEIGYSITSNSLSEIIILGQVDSSNFIVTSGIIQSTFGGGYEDCFVSKFSSSGSLVWSTFYGGTSMEYLPTKIKTDNLDNIIFSGCTYYSGFPTSLGCFQSTLKGAIDGFLVKINNSGTLVVFSTLFGGTETTSGSYDQWADYIQSISIDTKNNILVLGSSQATDLPVTTGAYQRIYGGGAADDYIAKFSPTGNLKWCTYYGNSYWELPGGIQVDNKDNVLILSEWEDDAFVNMPVLGCAYQKTFGGTEDQFFLKLDSTGSTLKCFTYIGGPNEDDLDGVYGLSYFNGSFFYTIYTIGGSYPVTSNAFQNIYGGGTYTTIIGKLCATSCGDTSNTQPNFTNSNQFCAGAPIQFFGIAAPCDTQGVKYRWQFSGGNPSISTQLNPVSSFTAPGLYSVKFVIMTPCGNDSIVKNVTLTIGNNCKLHASSTGGNICLGSCANVQVTPAGGVPPYTYLWSPNIGAGPGPYNVCPTSSTIYSVTITDNVNTQITTTLQVNIKQSPTFTPTASPLIGSAPLLVNFSASPQSSSIQYHWQCEDHFINNINSFSYTYDTAGVYKVFVVATDANGCQKGDTLYITVTKPTEPPAPIVPFIQVPNIFTPNSDGTNDQFLINTKYIATLHAIIYNRWGLKIAEINSPTQTWNGNTIKGEMCSEGTYYYILDASDIFNKEYKLKGFITLIR